MTNSRNWKWLMVHIVCWIIFLMLPGFFKPDRPYTSIGYLIGDMITPTRSVNGLLIIVVFYFNYLYAVPLLWLREQYFKYVAVFLLSFGLLIIANSWMRPDFHSLPEQAPIGYPGRKGPPPGPYDGPPPVRHMDLLGPSHNLFMFLMAYGFSFAAVIYKQYQRTKEEKLNAEVSFLKAQINPHFLFNTLNSIYSLTLTKDDHAPDAVLRLSSMMRYTTSEADQQSVSLSKELDYISNYVSLQRLRLSLQAAVHYMIDGHVEGYNIAPLLLIPFVENAFKYGVNAEEHSSISISIEVEKGILLLRVHNRKVRVMHAREEGTGIGLENTRQRLELLYPGRHSLEIQDEPAEFTVRLKLSLT